MNQKQKQSLVRLSSIFILILVGYLIFLGLNSQLFNIVSIIGLVVILLIWWVLAVLLIKPKKPINVKQTDLDRLAKQLYSALGGEENVVSVNRCSTRLLFEVIDSKQASTETIRALGFMGVIKPSNTKVQVIAEQWVEPLFERLNKKGGEL